MKLKITSILLFLLFSIVIAFPGYGSGNRLAKARTIVYASHSTSCFAAIKLVLKKCLSKGINMVEEERNAEEEDDGGGDGCSDFFDFTTNNVSAIHLTVASMVAGYYQPFYSPVYASIFTPPDCI